MNWIDWLNESSLQNACCLVLASPIPTALAKLSQMRSVAFAREERRFDVDSRPLFQPVHNSLGVRAVQSWPAHLSALLTPLVVDPDVVSRIGIQSYGHRYHLARPSIREAVSIPARKSAHDVGVVFSGTVERIIDVVKIKREAAVLQQTQHISMARRMKGPGVSWLGLLCWHLGCRYGSKRWRALLEIRIDL